jgi:hypothetical protein
MNIVLDEAIEEKPDGEKVRIGMVVCLDETNQTNRFFFSFQGNKTNCFV